MTNKYDGKRHVRLALTISFLLIGILGFSQDKILFVIVADNLIEDTDNKMLLMQSHSDNAYLISFCEQYAEEKLFEHDFETFKSSNGIVGEISTIVFPSMDIHVVTDQKKRGTWKFGYPNISFTEAKDRRKTAFISQPVFIGNDYALMHYTFKGVSEIVVFKRTGDNWVIIGRINSIMS
ncbi:hypothetical protein HZF10_10640 [Flavobacterium sp. MAH-1]|uniref:Uncharacterized protein n=2 Tax=Flavobacterium agri TaxID=2743471 RepID=A0A7Y8Y2X1_9FLAO|nr:hypothetical protein [Flavobacterium agri]